MTPEPRVPVFIAREGRGPGLNLRPGVGSRDGPWRGDWRPCPSENSHLCGQAWADGLAGCA